MAKHKLSRWGTGVALMLLVSGCVVDPSLFPTTPPPSSGGYEQPSEPPQQSRVFIKNIDYPAGGQIAYYRTYNSPKVKANTARICLLNNTGRSKAIVWSKAPSEVNDMRTPEYGSRSCASFALHQRLEWTFRDRGYAMKNDAMSLGNDSGTLIEFIWVRDT